MRNLGKTTADTMKMCMCCMCMAWCADFSVLSEQNWPLRRILFCLSREASEKLPFYFSVKEERYDNNSSYHCKSEY